MDKKLIRQELSKDIYDYCIDHHVNTQMDDRNQHELAYYKKMVYKVMKALNKDVN